MNRYLAINIEGKIGQSTVISKGLRPLLLKFKLYLFLNLFLNVIKSNKRLTYISHPQYKEDSDGLGLRRLTPLSTIFQLYRGSHFIGEGNQ
jgi:hypothetical protein